MTFNRPRLISLSKHTNLGGKGEPDLPYFDQGYLQALGTSTWSTLNEHCIKVWSTYLYIWNKMMKQVTAIFLTASWQPREIMGEWIKNSQQLCTRNTGRQTNIRRKDTVFVLSKCYDCTRLYLLQAMSTINTLTRFLKKPQSYARNNNQLVPLHITSPFNYFQNDLYVPTAKLSVTWFTQTLSGVGDLHFNDHGFSSSSLMASTYETTPKWPHISCR